MRRAAAFIALLCCVGWGLRKSLTLKKRVKFLREIQSMLKTFSVQIRCRAYTLDELLQNSGGSFAKSFEQHRGCCSDAKTAWNAACAVLPTEFEETALLRELGECLGTSDAAGQLSLLEMYGERIAELCNQAEDEYRRKGGPLLQVGIIGGVGCAVVIM